MLFALSLFVCSRVRSSLTCSTYIPPCALYSMYFNAIKRKSQNSEWFHFHIQVIFTPICNLTSLPLCIIFSLVFSSRCVSIYSPFPSRVLFFSSTIYLRRHKQMHAEKGPRGREDPPPLLTWGWIPLGHHFRKCDSWIPEESWNVLEQWFLYYFTCTTPTSLGPCQRASLPLLSEVGLNIPPHKINE